MFKSLFRLIVLVVAVSGWGLAAVSLHVIRTPDKIGLIPKDRLGFKDTYVDARHWTLADLPNHPELVKRLLETKKEGLFKFLVDPRNPDVSGQLAGTIKDAPEGQEFHIPAPVKSLFAPGGDKPQQTSGVEADSGITIPIEF